jgi:tight adherence protein B
MKQNEAEILNLIKFSQKKSARFLSIHSTTSAVLAFLFAFIVMGSRTLAIPFAVLGSPIPYLYARRKLDRQKAALAVIWPELLDHMISGLRSGLSIAETLIGLGYRGPEISRSIFIECEKFLRNGGDIAGAFEFIKRSFDDPIADQVCEVLDFARGTGSRDTALTLRTLGDFIRSDMAVRGEIRAKLGWVKNSAVVAAIAPWILLVILSAQPSTVLAFSTPTGFVILATGILMSSIAYLWMGKVGRIQEIPRIFSTSEAIKTRLKRTYQ